MSSDIPVTPEMIEAGEIASDDALHRMATGEIAATDFTLMAAVYRAMRALEPQGAETDPCGIEFGP